MRTFVVITIAISLGTAPAVVTAKTMTMVRTGWNVDAFAVVTAEPIANPAAWPKLIGIDLPR